jgi:hypothetical protein
MVRPSVEGHVCGKPFGGFDFETVYATNIWMRTRAFLGAELQQLSAYRLFHQQEASNCRPCAEHSDEACFALLHNKVLLAKSFNVSTVEWPKAAPLTLRHSHSLPALVSHHMMLPRVSLLRHLASSFRGFCNIVAALVPVAV